MSFEAFCTSVFRLMEKNIAERNELLFWGAGRVMPALEVEERRPGNGTWYATAKIAPGQTAGISVMLVHGECRVGSIVPKSLIDRDSDDDLIEFSPDGNRPDALREVEDAYLYDRSYQDPPFTAQWLIDAYTDESKAEAVALTMAALVSSTWRAAYHVISKYNQSGLKYPLMLLSEEPIPTTRLKREFELVIMDVSHAALLGYMAKIRSAVPADQLVEQLSHLGITNIQVSNHEEVEATSELEAA